jgi:hypothetical protein
MDFDPKSLDDLRQYRDLLEQLRKLATVETEKQVVDLLAAVEARIQRLEQARDKREKPKRA